MPVFIFRIKFYCFYSEEIHRFILGMDLRKKCRIIVEKCSKKNIDFSVK